MHALRINLRVFGHIRELKQAVKANLIMWDYGLTSKSSLFREGHTEYF